MAQSKPFAVQLRRVGISEISFKSLGFPEPGKTLSDTVGVQTGVGPYNAEGRWMHVFITATTAGEKGGEQGSLKLTLVGEFHVADESALPFPIERLQEWAAANGVTVLLPFLREHIYALTQRAGYTPTLFPLLEVNRFKIGTPDAPVPNVTLTKPATAGLPR